MEKYRHWCFTVNNYTDNDVVELSAATPKYKYLIYGKEVGASGTPHLQGFVSFPNPVRVATLHGWFSNRGHWEVARDPRAAAEYCKKEGDYKEFGTSPAKSREKQGRRTDLEALRDAINSGETCRKKLRQEFPDVCAKYPNFVSELILDSLPTPKLKCHPLREWQSKLLEILKRPVDDRTIHFVVDKSGNTGKSWFCRYHERNYGTSVILTPGKKADQIYAFISMVNINTKVVFFDAPRAKQAEFIQYDFLEELKNGRLFNTKYQSRMVEFTIPHVVVMMNEEPDMEKLSKDRYTIHRI